MPLCDFILLHFILKKRSKLLKKDNDFVYNQKILSKSCFVSFAAKNGATTLVGLTKNI